MDTRSSIDTPSRRHQHDDSNLKTREDKTKRKSVQSEDTPTTPSPKRLRKTKPTNNRPRNKASQKEALIEGTQNEIDELLGRRHQVKQTLRDMYEMEATVQRGPQQQQQAISSNNNNNNNNNNQYDTSFARSVTNRKVRVLLKEELDRLDAMYEKINHGMRLLVWRKVTRGRRGQHQQQRDHHTTSRNTNA